MPGTFDEPTSVTCSQLVDPAVLDRALVEPLRVELGADHGSFVTLPGAHHGDLVRLLELTAVFAAAAVELRRAEPSPVTLADVGFVAAWPTGDRDRFLAGFAEALTEAARRRSPAPAEAYIRIMATHDPAAAPSYLFGGHIEPGELEAVLAKRPGLAG